MTDDGKTGKFERWSMFNFGRRKLDENSSIKKFLTKKNNLLKYSNADFPNVVSFKGQKSISPCQSQSAID